MADGHDPAALSARLGQLEQEVGDLRSTVAHLAQHIMLQGTGHLSVVELGWLARLAESRPRYQKVE